ncbi:MAG: hypothetical protein ACREVX_05075 [Clostridium sp.]|uniref:hypothetical protein n=1 Tax=Clostridium sp. TaxID=1506 RepID=UPI003D6C78C4
MSVISNISTLQNPSSKKAFTKLSFEVGEKFSARIVNEDQQNGEVNLKLLDGWQFCAKLDKPLEESFDGNVLRFEVEGFEDDKLKIKLVFEDKDAKGIENDVLEDLSKGKSLSHDKADSIIFQKMIKHDMPLTRENITFIKSLIDFREKISLNTNKEDVFIGKYLSSRNIDINSEKANDTTIILKNFFTVLKSLNIDEILLFKENNIELTKENLESFTTLFKGDSVVYNDLKEISNYLLNEDEASLSLLNKELTQLGVKKNDSELVNKQVEIKSEEQPPQAIEKNTQSKVDSNSNTKSNGYGKNNSLNEIINMIKKELNFSEIDTRSINKEGINNHELEMKILTTEFLIKEQIKLKTEEIKNIVKDIIENKINLKPDSYSKVMSVFDQKFNDIKIFNSISEQYYYLDLPINVNENKYDLKLIIKDDRKKTKKIDSKNLQIATSIKTLNMGTVDAYIKINNNNMNIDIKCNKFYVNVLELGKEKLIKDLSSLSYKVNIKVNNKTSEFTLTSCADFFDDRSFNTLNIKV